MTSTKSHSRWRWICAALALVGIVGVSLYLERKQRLEGHWDQHLRETLAWYEEHVGSLDLESYRRPSVPAERNAGRRLRALLEIHPLDLETKNSLSSLVTRSFDLHRLEEESREAEPWTPEDSAGLERIVAGASALLQELDSWSQLTETSLGVVAGDSFGDWYIEAFAVSRLRLAEAALALESRDCLDASHKLTAVERLAAVLGAEPHLVLGIVDGAVELAFLEGVQVALEQELRGACDTQNDLEEIAAAFRHLEAVRQPLGHVLAAEGALFWRETHNAALGDPSSRHNPHYLTSSWLLGLGELVARASGTTLPPPPPRLHDTGNGDIIANMLVANLESSAFTEHRERYARALTYRLLLAAICAQRSGCSPEDLAPFEVPEGAVTQSRREGELVAIELSPEIADSAIPHRRRVLETVRVPLGYETAFR